jgi:glycosyltransferase involved in cell wall biosynthesis
MAIKAMGKRIIWTVHDVHPFKIRHEWLLWPYLAVLRWHIDGFVFMNQSSARQFLSTYPHEGNKPSCRIQHGPYPVRHLSERERACLRSEIAGMEPSFLLASLGDIKPYKNIEALGVSPRHTASGCPVKVLIAGKADPSHYSSQVEDLLNVLGRDRTIRISERLPNVQLEELIQIADLVVLPYREGSNSGFAMLALSCRARILCSPLSMFTDIANNAVWVMNRSRKWIFWRGSAVEIGLITLTQFVFVATIGVHTTRSAAMFSLVAVSASLFAQIYVMFFGFSRHRSSQE